jgi:hypothetical protein
MRQILIWLTSMVLAFAALQGSGQEPSSKDSEPNEFHLTLPPGQIFVVNFVINTGASAEAKFNNVSEIEAMGFAHPNSDLVERDGKVIVECPGLNRHQIAKVVQPSGDNMGIRAKQRGHYGMLWRNKGKDPVNLNVSLAFSPPNQVIFTSHNGANYRP